MSRNTRRIAQVPDALHDLAVRVAAARHMKVSDLYLEALREYIRVWREGDQHDQP